jgi:hypothetical protein
MPAMSTTESALDQALGELGTFFTQELAATQVALGCLRTTAQHVLDVVQAGVDPDGQDVLVGLGIPNVGWVAPIHGLDGALALRADVAEGGRIAQRLTQQLIVTLYTAWEHQYRSRIAEAHGCHKDNIKSQFFGELGWLRNDIVHSRGLATSRYAVQCTTLLITPPGEGQPIYLTDQELQRMHQLIPWAALVKKPT